MHEIYENIIIEISKYNEVTSFRQNAARNDIIYQNFEKHW